MDVVSGACLVSLLPCGLPIPLLSQVSGCFCVFFRWPKLPPGDDAQSRRFSVLALGAFFWVAVLGNRTWRGKDLGPLDSQLCLVGSSVGSGMLLCLALSGHKMRVGWGKF